MENVTLNETLDDLPPLAERAVEGVLLIFICILAMGGNLTLWIVVIRTPDLHSASNFLLLCLSAADLLVAAVNMPLTAFTILVGRWMLPDEMCVTTGFTNMFSFVASVMSLCMITFNRYIRVCRPDSYHALYSPRAALLHITGVCCLSAILSSPPLLGWGEYGYVQSQFFCYCRWRASLSYAVFMVAFCFGGTSSLMAGCYVAIYRKFTRSKRLLIANTGSSNIIAASEEPGLDRDGLQSSGTSRTKRNPDFLGGLKASRQRITSNGNRKKGRERLGSFGASKLNQDRENLKGKKKQGCAGTLSDQSLFQNRLCTLDKTDEGKKMAETYVDKKQIQGRLRSVKKQTNPLVSVLASGKDKMMGDLSHSPENKARELTTALQWTCGTTDLLEQNTVESRDMLASDHFRNPAMSDGGCRQKPLREKVQEIAETQQWAGEQHCPCRLFKPEVHTDANDCAREVQVNQLITCRSRLLPGARHLLGQFLTNTRRALDKIPATPKAFDSMREIPFLQNEGIVLKSFRSKRPAQEFQCRNYIPDYETRPQQKLIRQEEISIRRDNTLDEAGSNVSTVDGLHSVSGCGCTAQEARTSGLLNTNSLSTTEPSDNSIVSLHSKGCHTNEYDQLWLQERWSVREVCEHRLSRQNGEKIATVTGDSDHTSAALCASRNVSLSLPDLKTNTSLNMLCIPTTPSVPMLHLSTVPSISVPCIRTRTSVSMPCVSTNASVSTSRFNINTSKSVPGDSTNTQTLMPAVSTNTKMLIPHDSINNSMSTSCISTNAAISTSCVSTITSISTSNISTITSASTSCININTAVSTSCVSTVASVLTPCVSTNTSGSTPCVSTNTSLSTPCVSTNTSVSTPCVSTNTSVSTPCVSTNTSVSTPCVSTNTSVSTPCVSTNTSVSTPCVSTNTSVSTSCVSTNTSVSTSCVSTNTSVSTPCVRTNTSVSTPCDSTNTSVSTSCVRTNTSVSTSCVSTNTSVSTSCVSTNTSVSTPCVRINTSVSTPCVSTNTSVSTSCVSTNTSVSTSCFNTNTSVSTPCVNTNTSLSTPCVSTNTSVSTSCVNTDTSVSTPCVSTNTSLSTSCVNTNTSLSTPCVSTNTSLSTPCVSTNTSVSTPCVSTNTSVSTPCVSTNTSVSTPCVSTSTTASTLHVSNNTSASMTCISPNTSVLMSSVSTSTSMSTSCVSTNASTLMPRISTSTSIPMSRANSNTSMLTPRVSTSTPISTPRVSTSTPISTSHVSNNTLLSMRRVSTFASLSMPRVSTNVSLSMPRVGTNTSLASSKERRRREEMRLTSTMLLVMFAYVISWLPYCVLILVRVLTSEDQVPRWVDMLTLLMGYSNSLYNPFIYGWRNANIRRGYVKLWRDLGQRPAGVCGKGRKGRPPKVVFEL